MTNPVIMNKEKNQATEKILNLTLEIIYLLTGRIYIAAEESGDPNIHIRNCVSDGRTRTCSPGDDPPPHPLIDEKILELTHTISRLLTGEVPVRCEDVTVYLSMEEWEYLEGHRDLYKHVLMEDHKPKDMMTEDHKPKDMMTEDHKPKDVATEDHKPKDMMVKDCLRSLGDVMDGFEADGQRNAQNKAKSNSKDHLKINPKKKSLRINHTKKKSCKAARRVKRAPPSRQQASSLDRNIYTDKEHSEHASFYINVEAASHKDGNFVNSGVYVPAEHTQCKSTCKGGSASPREGNASISGTYTTTEHPSTAFYEGSSPNQEVHKLNTGIYPPSQTHYIPVEVKEESCMYEADALTYLGICERTEDPQRTCRSLKIKEQPVSSHNGNDSITDILVPSACTQAECASVAIKQESGSDASTNIFLGNDQAEYTPVHIKEEIGFGEDFPEMNQLTGEEPTETAYQRVLPASLGKRYGSKSYLKKHLMLFTEDKPFFCSECGKSFRQEQYLAIHQRIHTGEKPYSCSVCGKRFIRRSYLNLHERIHVGDKPFSCSKCKKCFNRKSTLNRHQKIHTGEKPFSCSECWKSFTQKSSLVTHWRIHTGEKPIACSQCKVCFRDASGLYRHNFTHSGDAPFSCSDCGKSFSQKTAFKSHQRIHSGEKKYSCTECGKSFIHKSRLLRHQVIHTGEKTFACSECSKFFSSESSLYTHQKIHTGEKPFFCSDCGKRFGQKSHLVVHQRTHTGEKTFMCTECRKCFSQKSHLVAHWRIHTGEKPFACSNCGKCFGTKNSLNKHLKMHT